MFLRSAFSKIHFSTAIFILINIISGFGMFLGIGYSTFSLIHPYSGFLIWIIPLIVLLFLRNRKMVLKSLKSIVFVRRQDIKNKKMWNILTKISANVLLIQLLLLTGTGILMKFPELGKPEWYSTAYDIHRINFQAMWFVLPFHLVLAVGKRVKK